MTQEVVTSFKQLRARRREMFCATVSILLLALATVGLQRAEAHNSVPESTIERPSNRAAPQAFVPRLGKRDESAADLERQLCANSPECSRLTLIGALLRGIQTQDSGETSSNSLAELRLLGDASSALANELAGSGELLSLSNGQREARLPLLDLLLIARQQQQELQQNSPQQRLQHPMYLIKRKTRASDLGQAASELAGAQFSGAKRVAFTPRIGR